MTGFGFGEADLDTGRVVVEIRSLNHRFLDVRVRLPADLQDQASYLEQLARAELGRGRYDVGVRVEGDFEVRDGTRIDFVPRQVAVDDAVVPPFILETLARSEAFRVGVDLDALPLPLEVQRVQLDPGWIVVHAEGPRRVGGAGR